MRARSDFPEAAQADEVGTDYRLQARGVFACISPWNFPLAIFTGQVSAALAAGNAVVSKPAEQTPLIAARAVGLLHQAGVPHDVLAFLPGQGGEVGAALTSDPRIAGAAFTGSTETARVIYRSLAGRTAPIVPLIAETGGQNAMIVDSSALPEQVTRDVLASAFQSAGQRCSALRVMFVQDDIADRQLDMIAGAMAELKVGDPALLSTDVGPVIDEAARRLLMDHAERMTVDGKLIYRTPMPEACDVGTFVPPMSFEIDRIGRLEREVFGPILHVVRYAADRLDAVIESINRTGYGLTLGVHSRVDSTVDHVLRRIRVGNCYVNRNQIGAVVGVQPFGGEGLSGTGPKAGGPNYLHRFARVRPSADRSSPGAPPASATVGLKPDVDQGVFPDVSPAQAVRQLAEAYRRHSGWDSTPVAQRADTLVRTAGLFERDRNRLAGLIRTVSGMTEEAAQQEVAASVEALQNVAMVARRMFAAPLQLAGPTGERNEMFMHGRGPILCVGPSAIPMAPLAVQIGAALAAGCTVLAKPSMRTTLVGGSLVALFHEAGFPPDVLHLLPGDGASIGAALMADDRLAGVAFAGSLETARAINLRLANGDGPIIPLIHRLVQSESAMSELLATMRGPIYLARFATERTVSMDTTAAGGNAALLAMDEDDIGN